MHQAEDTHLYMNRDMARALKDIYYKKKCKVYCKSIRCLINHSNIECIMNYDTCVDHVCH